jgi:nicotinamide-nucleotide amidase
MAVVGDDHTVMRTLRTGSDDRVANMRAFAEAALKLLVEVLESAPTRADRRAPQSRSG